MYKFSRVNFVFESEVLKMCSLKNFFMTVLLTLVATIFNITEAGIVTDKMPLQCYVDHKVTSYDLNSGQAVGWIDAEVDLVQIKEIGGNGVSRGTHPGRNGTVERLFWARDVFADTNYSNRNVHVNGYHEVYRTKNSGATIGSINNEEVTVVADNGNRAQIIYRLNNGTGYKMGWVPSSIVANNQPVGANFQLSNYNLSCPSDHQLRFTGRVWNANDNSEITGVHVYIGGGAGAGGEFMGEFRSDSNHNFEANLNVPQHRNGNQLIVIYAVNGKDSGELNRTNINVSPQQNNTSTVSSGNLQNLINTFTNPSGQKWDNRESNQLGNTCFGFANYIFRELHGVRAASSYINNERHILTNISQGVSCRYSGSVNENTLHTLFQQCKPGDFIQATRSDGSGQHSMIFVSYDANSRNVRIFDANFTTAHDNLIQDRKPSTHQFFARFQKVSIYTK